MFSSLYFAVLLGLCQAGDVYVPFLPNVGAAMLTGEELIAS